MLLRLYRHQPTSEFPKEECYYVECARVLSEKQLAILNWLISEPGWVVTPRRHFVRDSKLMSIKEGGPRLSVETAFSSNATSVCRSIGLPITRIERSYRSVALSLDPMTEQYYNEPLTTFDSGITPEPVRSIDNTVESLREANVRLGLGMDDADIAYYTQLFERLGRDPTDVELFQLGNANSEHSRHHFFRGIQVIDGTTMPRSLMDVVKEPWKQRPGRSLVAFHDNAGVMRGTYVRVFEPSLPGEPSNFRTKRLMLHYTATAETHNHPTLVAPFPGAETGAGGRIRDNRAVGRGGLTHAGLAGYCVGALDIPGYTLPGEMLPEAKGRFALPLRVLIEGSNGVSDYGNKIGEPLIGGFCRNFGQYVDGVRREFYKPVLYTAGVGTIRHEHVRKHPPRAGLRIVRFGGPAYRIGVGGGAASSMGPSQNTEALDLMSVQRGNAEMENRANRVIQTCAELGPDNPIENIHDQGAGGPSNVLTELMEPKGGRVDIRRITQGDRTMSVLELWVAEYQEGYGALVAPENLERFKRICARERVACEVLGEVTGNGHITVIDSANHTTPVNLPLRDVLSEMPQKRFVSNRRRAHLLPEPAQLPTLDQAARQVLLQPSVGSKGFLVRKVDRSVTGLVAQQQCCGPAQIPVADAAVKADGYFGLTGVATALGEQPLKVLIDPKAGARMVLAEMLTNLACVHISDLSDVRCRANWMWAAKRDGEGANLWDAAVAMRDAMLTLGIAIDGGKDSLSMAADAGGEVAVSPGQLVIMGYAPVPDIRRVATPDLKGGYLSLLDLGQGHTRLGGSALLQSMGQLGNECPDVNPALVAAAFRAVQEMRERNLLLSYHDKSDGGLFAAVAEMAMAGLKGVCLSPPDTADPVRFFFNEEAGMVIEYQQRNWNDIRRIARRHGVPMVDIGYAAAGDKMVVIQKGERLFERPLARVREWWEETSTELDELQANLACVNQEYHDLKLAQAPKYHLTFSPKDPVVKKRSAYKVAILREEGVNGDREMAAAFYTAGLDPVDIAMQDILAGDITDLSSFRGLVFPGGFSYADVFGSGRGWASPLRFSPKVSRMFERFYERLDTFSLGVCNGCQLMATIGWVPMQGLSEEERVHLVHNDSGRFESRWATVRIEKSPAVMLKGMEESVLGVWVAHGEGKFYSPDPTLLETLKADGLVPLVYTTPGGEATERYPYNPNGSPLGIAGLCSPDGRHLAMMPHPERCFLPWQWPWMPRGFATTSPWLQMFINARLWCKSH